MQAPPVALYSKWNLAIFIPQRVRECWRFGCTRDSCQFPAEGLACWTRALPPDVGDESEASAKRRGTALRIVSVGEVLWDVIGDKEYLGGAALNFSAHAARLGHQVHFVSAVGKDERGRRVLERMDQLGLSARFVHAIDEYPTGIVTVE